MKRILIALALLGCGSALAADNAVTVTVGAGTTMRTKDVGAGVQAPVVILGAPDGSTSPVYSTLTSPTAGTLIWPPGTVPITAGTLSTSAAAGTLIWPPGTVPITAGTLTVSATTGSNFVAPVQIGSAPTLVTSTSSASLVAPVNCISGCNATATVNATYNQVPATLVSGATSGLQADQQGSLKVNIVSQLASTLTTSQQAGTLVWPPGTPTGLTAGQAAATVTGSLIMAEAATAPVAVASGSVSNLTTDLNSQLRATLGASTTGGCTSSYVTASTSNIFTQVKSSGGTLCWLRIVNASTVTATVRLYDTTINGNLACQGSTAPVSYDLVQPNTASPGSVTNLGPYGMNFNNGLGLCLTGSSGGTFPFQDTTSLTTNALFVNIGVK